MKKSLKVFCYYALFISVILFGSCAVENLSYEDTVPIMKAAAVQPFVFAQVTRWMTLTNDSTPYSIGAVTFAIETNVDQRTNYVTITNVVPGFQTNGFAIIPIADVTNISEEMSTIDYNTNIYNWATVPISYNGSYSYSGSIQIAAFLNSNKTTLLTEYSNLATFNTFLSNTKYAVLKGEINYTKDTVQLKTIYTDFEVSSGSDSSMFTNNANIFGDTEFRRVSISGTYGDNQVDVHYEEKFDISFEGSMTNDFENISGSPTMYIGYNHYVYSFSFLTTYAGGDDRVVLISGQENNSENTTGISVDLVTGE